MCTVAERTCRAKCPCCKACKGCANFQKVLDLKKAGLIIYRHTKRLDEVNTTTGALESSLHTTDDVFIVKNTQDSPFPAVACISAVDEEVSCPRCRELLKRAQKYIPDNKNIISVCDHCETEKLVHNYCCKCHKIIKKNIAERDKQNVAKEKIKTWLLKVHKVLTDVLSDKRTGKGLKLRAQSELYLNNLVKRDLSIVRRLDVGSILEHDDVAAKSESALLLVDSKETKIKSVKIKTQSFDQIESHKSSSIATYTSSLGKDAENVKGVELKEQVIQSNLVTNIRSSQIRKKYFSEEAIYVPISGRAKDNLKKKPQTVTKYYSDAAIFVPSDLTDYNLKKTFSYIFPKVESDEVPLRRVKTSTELIVDTQKKLKQRFIDEKAKQIRKITPRKQKKIEQEKQEDSLKVQKSEEKDIIPEKLKTKKSKKSVAGLNDKENKLEKMKVQQEDHSREKKLQLEGEKRKEKEQKGKEKEEKQRDKHERLQKEKEEKQRLKDEQKKIKEEKLKNKDIKIKKTEKPQGAEDEKKEKRAEKSQLREQEKKEQKPEKSQKKDIQEQEKPPKKENETKRSEREEEDEIAKKQKWLEEQAQLKSMIMNQKIKKPKEDDKFKKSKADKELILTKTQKERKTKTRTDKTEQPKQDQEKPKEKSKDTEENLSKKKLNMKQIKMQKPSTDNLILQLVKLRQEGKKPKRLSEIHVTPKMIQQHKVHVGKKRPACAMCMDSDMELDVESIVNKKSTSEEIIDIIVGNNILQHKRPLNDNAVTEENIPILYKSVFKEDEPLNVPQDNLLENAKDERKDPNERTQFTLGPRMYVEQELPKGVIRYALSDRSFIDKGWTMLPTEKVVRKMNVYRMRPAHPEFDWFEHNKNKRLMLYDTGEKLAEFDDNGRGRWFYRNGRLALDYYDAEEMNAQQRLVVYGSGEPDERGRYRPIAILATFDYLGNGVVFDHAGKIRLKYNQTEGVVLDRGIGPVSNWKWHTLNDPPVLQQVMIDTQMAHKDPEIIKLGGSGDDKVRPDNEEMLAIEFDNFIKEKSKKLSQKFKPFQIRTKALKINENFSLRVLDQANIYLIFRDGKTNIKMNIGMILDHQEIVDTDTAEVGEVSNSLERFPARTDSLAGLQRSVAYAQRVERSRIERERRLKHPEPSSSADALVAATSKPLRSQLHTVQCSSSTSKDCYCKCRKPSSLNLYYDTRLV